jgi:CDGSH-type Zn-finger protein
LSTHAVDAILAPMRLMTGAKRHATWGIVAAVVAAAILSGCGGSSSKPSYCDQTANLKKSVQSLGSVNVLQGGTNALTSAISNVESSASAVVKSAKGDFPTETAAISSSIDALKKSAQSLASSPAQPAVIAQIPGQVSAVVKSIQDFSSSTKSKCS